jgi:Zn-finger nucleic acid-binding protein
MFDFDALCPHCEKKFKLSMVGLEAKEFIQCPHCRKIIKLDLADPKKRQYGLAQISQTNF